MTGYGTKDNSDTADFINTIINNISRYNDIDRILTATADRTSSKFALMTSQGVTLYGAFETIDGVYYSNTYWRWRSYYWNYYNNNNNNKTKNSNTLDYCDNCGALTSDVTDFLIDGIHCNLCNECASFYNEEVKYNVR